MSDRISESIEATRLLEDYPSVSSYVRETAPEDMVIMASEVLKCEIDLLLTHAMGGVSKGRRSGVYWFVLSDLKKNIDHYDWLYERLYDEESRRVFYLLVLFRLIPDVRLIKEAFDAGNPQYFVDDILSCDENEVFVDCGGFTGDTIQSYIAKYGEKYRKCYVYEPDSENAHKAADNLGMYDNIVIRQAGVGEKNEQSGFAGSGSSGSFLKGSDDSDQISIVSLDEDIDEPVTYIKMDVEGFEIPAIIGTKRHIIEDRPKLAICLYHIVSDMWEIPRIIDSLCPDYRFHIRHHQEDWNWETVLYAIPPERVEKTHEVRQGVTVRPYEHPWRNVELIKDCGLIPFLLHKNHGIKTAMVGVSGNMEDYPYSTLVEGMELISLPGLDVDTKLSYVMENASDIDLLILRGPYEPCLMMAEVYRSLRPDGWIYCGLDANSEWMDRIPWTEGLKHFIDNCDILATSCSSMAECLSRKWGKKVYTVTNGYYDFFMGEIPQVPFDKKENTILSVGRLGTRQKATDVLLNAFAEIADEIPDWILKLVGSVEEEFKPFFDSFFRDHPELRDRVCLTEGISDRRELMSVYEKAKIFALPSTWEGGAPNVIGEALHAGCVTAVTRFDAWQDCIDGEETIGKCGACADIGDISGYAEILKTLVSSPDLIKMSENAREYATERFNMEKNVEWLYSRITGTEKNVGMEV